MAEQLITKDILQKAALLLSSIVLSLGLIELGFALKSMVSIAAHLRYTHKYGWTLDRTFKEG